MNIFRLIRKIMEMLSSEEYCLWSVLWAANHLSFQRFWTTNTLKNLSHITSIHWYTHSLIHSIIRSITRSITHIEIKTTLLSDLIIFIWFSIVVRKIQIQIQVYKLISCSHFLQFDFLLIFLVSAKLCWCTSTHHYKINIKQKDNYVINIKIISF